MGLPAWRDRVEDGEREIEDAGGKLVGVWVRLGRYEVVEVFEAEDPVEERRRAIWDGAAGAGVPARLCDEPAFQEVGDGRVGGDAADSRDVRPRRGPEVRDDRGRLERGLGQVPLRGPLEQARACGGLLAPRAKRPAARDVLEHDPASLLGKALAHEAQRVLDPPRVVVCGFGKLLDGERRRSDDEQRLDRPCEPVEWISRDQAERTVHAAVLTSRSLFSCASGAGGAAVFWPGVAGSAGDASSLSRLTRIGANGAACSIASSPARRSSSTARKADACSSRVISPTSASKSNFERRLRSARNRSRNCETGGKRRAMCESETSGGSCASTLSACPSASGSCGASCVLTFGASGAGPRRK